MRIKFFGEFILFIFFICSGCLVGQESIKKDKVASDQDVKFLKKLKSDEKSKELLELILQQVGSNVTTTTENQQSGQKQLFKKRDLISLLGLLGFSGINFGVFYKVFKGANNKKVQIVQLEAQQQVIQEKLGEIEKLLDKVQNLTKESHDTESLKKELELLAKNQDQQTKNMSDLVSEIKNINREVDEKIKKSVRRD